VNRPKINKFCGASRQASNVETLSWRCLDALKSAILYGKDAVAPKPHGAAHKNGQQAASASAYRSNLQRNLQLPVQALPEMRHTLARLMPDSKIANSTGDFLIISQE